MKKVKYQIYSIPYRMAHEKSQDVVPEKLWTKAFTVKPRIVEDVVKHHLTESMSGQKHRVR